MRLLADRHIFLAPLLETPGVSVTWFDSLEGLPDQTGADAVFVRTVTPVTAAWAKRQPSVRFVATASAGFDHLETAALEAAGLQWASSPGCNARSVAEWVMAALWAAEGDALFESQRSIGLVGAGNAGSAVGRLFEAAGFTVVCYDPPRQARESGFRSATEADIRQCDIVSVHTPLNAETRGFFDARFWGGGRRLAVVNAARGGILDETAALAARASGSIRHLLLDVWAGEPQFSDAIAQSASVATPHIAGYSFPAKIRATRIAAEAMFRFFGLSPAIPWPEPGQREISVETPAALLDALHPVRSVHRAFMTLAFESAEEKARRFHALRQEQNNRPEWGGLTVKTGHAAVAARAARLGAAVAHD